MSVKVTVKLEPEAYQTSATDLQLPAPTLPISLGRSYSSRNVDASGVLGTGWTALWGILKGSSFKLILKTTGSQFLTQLALTGSQFLYHLETAAHFATVTLPLSGQSIGFAAQLNIGGFPQPATFLPSDGDECGISFASFSPRRMWTLQCQDSEITLASDVEDADSWTGGLSFDNFGTDHPFTYTTADGMVYTFGLSSTDGFVPEWWLTQITDRNGNSQAYVYDSNKSLVAITNSCGRKVRIDYSMAGEVDVFDTIDQTTNPVVRYLLTNTNGANYLTQVLKMVDRSATPPRYETNQYQYGNSDIADNAHRSANTNRLTDVMDARGVRAVHNQYRPDNGDYISNGDLDWQAAGGQTNLYLLDLTDNSLTVQSVSATATNTAQLACDSSGSLIGATQPTNGVTPAATLATQVTYDDRGRVVAQTDANGNTKTFAYDDLDRLVGQADANGNGTSVQLDNYGQPTISTDARGQQTDHSYDNNGNPTSVSDPSGTTTSYTYLPPVTDSGLGLGNVGLRRAGGEPGAEGVGGAVHGGDAEYLQHDGGDFGGFGGDDGGMAERRRGGGGQAGDNAICV